MDIEGNSADGGCFNLVLEMNLGVIFSDRGSSPRQLLSVQSQRHLLLHGYYKSS